MIRYCNICGKAYEVAANVTNARYCSEKCQAIAAQKRKEEQKLKKEKDVNKRLTEKARICKERGITYGQLQAEETLRLVRRGEL